MAGPRYTTDFTSAKGKSFIIYSGDDGYAEWQCLECREKGSTNHEPDERAAIMMAKCYAEAHSCVSHGA